MNDGASCFIWFYSREPLLMWGLLDCFGDTKLTSLLAAHYAKPCGLFVSPMYSIEHLASHDQPHLEKLLASCREFHDAVPGNRLTLLCNTHEEVALLQARGLTAVEVHQNSFVNENTFYVMSGVKKIYSAIYNAQFLYFKRHRLATEIEDLALIYAIWAEPRLERYQKLRQLLPHAHLLNGAMDEPPGSPAAYRRLLPPEVNAALARARTGLCLSDAEGAMYASFEYLLAGLPVISTPAHGGRERLFPPEFATIVGASTAQIAAAVRDVGERDHEPHAIRAAALALAYPHRSRFRDLLDAKARALGCDAAAVQQRHDAQRRDTSHGSVYLPAGKLAKALRDDGH